MRRVFEGHHKGVLSVAYSERFKLVASAGIERTIHIWDPFNRQVSYTVSEHHAAIILVAFADDAKLLVSVSVDKVVKLWDASTNFTCVQTMTIDTPLKPEDYISAALFDQSSKMLVLTHAKLLVFDLSHAGSVAVVSHKDPVTTMVYNDHFNQVVSADEGGVVTVWDVLSGRALHRFRCPTSVTALAFDTNKRRLLVGTTSGAVLMYNISNGQKLSEFIIPPGSSAEKCIQGLKSKIKPITDSTTTTVTTTTRVQVRGGTTQSDGTSSDNKSNTTHNEYDSSTDPAPSIINFLRRNAQRKRSRERRRREEARARLGILPKREQGIGLDWEDGGHNGPSGSNGISSGGILSDRLSVKSVGRDDNWDDDFAGDVVTGIYYNYDTRGQSSTKVRILYSVSIFTVFMYCMPLLFWLSLSFTVQIVLDS